VTPAPATPPRLPFGSVGGVAVFSALAIALGWAVALPLWVMGIDFADSGAAGDAPADSAVLRVLIPAAMMFTPAVAALITAAAVHRMRFGEALTVFGAGRPRGPAGEPASPELRHRAVQRVILVAALGVAAMLLLTVLTVPVAMLLGGFAPDWSMTGLRTALADAGVETPLWLLLMLQLIQIPVAAVIPNGLLALGEELGWRGYLTPALRSRGIILTIVASGVIWGIWHAPLILLGYNFGSRAWWTVPVMCLGCIALGGLFAWLREISGSVWPPVVAHGAVNAAAGVGLMLTRTGSWEQPWIASPLGAAGWVVFGGALVMVLVLRRRSRTGRVIAGRRRDVPS
jgi:uncharacterized protein